MRHCPSEDNDLYLWYEEVKSNVAFFFPSKEHFEDKFIFVAFNRKKAATKTVTKSGQCII